MKKVIPINKRREEKKAKEDQEARIKFNIVMCEWRRQLQEMDVSPKLQAQARLLHRSIQSEVDRKKDKDR